jgi:hypothetical protein
MLMVVQNPTCLPSVRLNVYLTADATVTMGDSTVHEKGCFPLKNGAPWSPEDKVRGISGTEATKVKDKCDPGEEMS